MKTVLVIPARMSSSRFPAKPLHEILGVSMLERVWRLAKAVKRCERVVIATDSAEIESFAEGFGAEVKMTPASCRTGLDRIAATIDLLEATYDVAVSFQGDAVITPPWIVDDVLMQMEKDQSIQIATPMIRLLGKAQKDFRDFKSGGSSTGTTVTFDKAGNALYFSKTIIPYVRSKDEVPIFRHIGLYAYRPDVLRKLASLEQSPFEKVEQLEQLRALENQIPIKVVEVDYRGRTHASVDNPEDIAVVENIIRIEGELI